MSAQSAIKLTDVQPYIDEDKAVAVVASHYGEPVELARTQMAQAELSVAQAGL